MAFNMWHAYRTLLGIEAFYQDQFGSVYILFRCKCLKHCLPTLIFFSDINVTVM